MQYIHNGRTLHIADAHAHIYPNKIAEKAVHAVGDFYNIPMSSGGTAEDLISGLFCRYTPGTSAVHHHIYRR